AGGQKVIALVGPTGAGKTTTCAKLAARMALGEGVRVGLLTQDTYRIGAVEQLRKYARILEMDLEVVFTPGEMGPALRRLGDSQVVLIDTAGHNPRDRRWMERLREFLAAAAADEVHLVLSAATATEDARAVMAHYRKVAYNRLLLTKIDETDRPGRAVALARDAGVPLSYVCTGQEVPDDIGPASDVLSGLLLRGVV
ncbi:MAG: GTPase, partial [Bacillota bacterium]